MAPNFLLEEISILGGTVNSPNIIKWTGTAWEGLAGGAPVTVGSIAAYGGKLWIANEFSTGSNFVLRLD